MLLPKRLKRQIIKKGGNPNEVLLRKLVKFQNPKDAIFLDTNNALVFFEKESNSIIIHERLENGHLIQINQWISMQYDYSRDMITIINQLSVLKKANNKENYDTDYSCKNGNYTIKNGLWESINFEGIKDLSQNYKGVLGKIRITSDYEEDDIYTFKSPITKEKVVENFEVSDGNYYAILNLDGTIRGNKLFKGSTFSKLEEPIDLDEYESLEEFIKIRKEWCNQMKQRNKKYYREMISQKGDGSVSPYLDEEVLRILELKNKNY